MPARTDASAAPHADLLEMRRGTAHFARVLNDLSDAEISEHPVRRWTIAKISLDARDLAMKVKSLRSTLTEEEANLDLNMQFAASLPPHALRHLFTHSALHLNVELRDLQNTHWPCAMQVPKQRAIQIWRAAQMLRSKDEHAHQDEAFMRIPTCRTSSGYVVLT